MRVGRATASARAKAGTEKGDRCEEATPSVKWALIWNGDGGESEESAEGSGRQGPVMLPSSKSRLLRALYCDMKYPLPVENLGKLPLIYRPYSDRINEWKYSPYSVAQNQGPKMMFTTERKGAELRKERKKVIAIGMVQKSHVLLEMPFSETTD
ncbi:hypothetical protein EI94DRAFT_1790545 [Lactarius quietus]|nr:hypothetical protein EI94DRAFT_1790545 [Lactarius quietus]